MKKSFLLLAVVAGMTISASALSNGTKTGTFEREQVDTVKTKTDSTVNKSDTTLCTPNSRGILVKGEDC